MHDESWNAAHVWQGDNPDAICGTCRGQRYCPECLGWSDREIPCSICDNTGDCPRCQGTGTEPEEAA